MNYFERENIVKARTLTLMERCTQCVENDLSRCISRGEATDLTTQVYFQCRNPPRTSCTLFSLRRLTKIAAPSRYKDHCVVSENAHSLWDKVCLPKVPLGPLLFASDVLKNNLGCIQASTIACYSNTERDIKRTEITP